MKILSKKQEVILKDERRLLNNLNVSLVRFGAEPEDLQTLTETIEQLDELFLLVVVGEFNAGKSAFINALLGQKMLVEGVTPTTTQINVLTYGAQQDRKIISEHELNILLPVDMLAEISIVDTPGTNAIIRTHEAITSKFIPRSDLVLFVTSSDRPFTESERAFLEKIRDWGKKVVIVVNKIDILQSEEDLDKILAFVSENAMKLLGITPEIFPVSARNALRAKRGDPSLWVESQFEGLETFIRETLDETNRVRLKFLNPLGVGSHLIKQYMEIIQSRLDLLKDDFAMISDVDAQLEVYRGDMQRDFNFRMADIENILFEMDQRGQEYFDETFRLARVKDLVSKDRIRKEFEQRVVKDVPDRIDHKVSELIDWLVNSDLRQWQAVNEHLAERRQAHRDRIVGDTTGGKFEYDRERLMDAVGREAQRVVDTYDRIQEADAIAKGAQDAVAASAILEVGAVSLGTIVAILASTVAADVTGVIFASLIAVIGLFIIPARRKLAKEELRQKISAMRQQLVQTLRLQFEKEIDRSLMRIHDAIAPYTRFVRAERSYLSDTQTELEGLRSELEQLRLLIDELGNPED